MHRNLAGEIGQEFREESSTATEDLLSLVNQIVPYHMKHHAETEAVDLLLEVRAALSTQSLLASCTTDTMQVAG